MQRIIDTRKSGRERKLNLDECIADAKKAAQHSPVVMAYLGGSVPKSYKYTAYTDAITVVVFPSGSFVAIAKSIYARGARPCTVLRNCLDGMSGNYLDLNFSQEHKNFAFQHCLDVALDILVGDSALLKEVVAA